MAEVRRAAAKRLSAAAAAQAVASWRARGQRVVLANGVFDLLHAGHVRYLEAARRHGDRLVVAVYGDDATAQIKGGGRPVLPASERAALVASLRCVDVVVVFEDATLDPVLDALRPDVHAQGASRHLDAVPGRAKPEPHAVRTVITGVPETPSTRERIERVKERLRGHE